MLFVVNIFLGLFLDRIWPNYLSSSLVVDDDFPWFASLNIELNHPPLVKRCFWGNCNVSIIAWRAHVRASEYKGSLHLAALLKGHLIQSRMKIKQLNYGLINTQMSENFLGRQVCNLMIVQLFFIEILQLPFFSLPLLDREPDFFSHCPLFIFSGM